MFLSRTTHTIFPSNSIIRHELVMSGKRTEAILTNVSTYVVARLRIQNLVQCLSCWFKKSLLQYLQ